MISYILLSKISHIVHVVEAGNKTIVTFEGILLIQAYVLFESEYIITRYSASSFLIELIYI